MRTLEEVIAAYEAGERDQCLDGRDVHRLVKFVPEPDLARLGVTLKPEYVGSHVAEEFTRDAVLAQLSGDVAFGFEKALDQRGLSAGLMAQVVQLWNWVLDEGLADLDEYPQYGLPIFKATAVKYGFPNPIGDDTGSELKYAD